MKSKINKKVAFTKTIKYCASNFILMTCILTALFIASIQYIPQKNLEDCIAIVFIASIGFGLYKWRSKYLSLISWLEFKDYLYDLSGKDPVVAKQSLEKGLISSKSMVDRYKMQLDILKSISPIALIVFLLGIIVNNQNQVTFVKIIKKFKLESITSLDLIQFLYIILVIIIGYYIYSFREAWIKFYESLKYASAFEEELVYYKDVKSPIQENTKLSV